jgi:hypothetical protein
LISTYFLFPSSLTPFEKETYRYPQFHRGFAAKAIASTQPMNFQGTFFHHTLKRILSFQLYAQKPDMKVELLGFLISTLSL